MNFVREPSEQIKQGMIVDFQLIVSVPISESTALRKVAQLTSPFVEQMIVHFASYTSRIAGDRVDDLKAQEMITKISAPYCLSEA